MTRIVSKKRIEKFLLLGYVIIIQSVAHTVFLSQAKGMILLQIILQ